MSKRIVPFALMLLVVAAGFALYSQRSRPPGSEPAPEGFTVRILLGVTDREPANWDGSVRVTPGRIVEVRGWRFGGNDSASNDGSWQLSTRESPGKKGKAGPVLENGVIVTADTRDPGARFEVKTAQGSFSFQQSDVAFGEAKAFLDGRVLVDRVPSITELSPSPEEQDFPAIAQSDDAVWVSYVEFTHSDREAEARRSFEQEPANFDFLARPAGGDQVLLARYDKARKQWGAPVAVSAKKQDVMRTAVAVDASQRVWVFWSANQGGNFDIYAKSYSNGRWSAEQKLTSDAGTDINPAAASDAKGRVWVTWQAFRKGNLEILAAAQNGNAFTPETVVSFSGASDWDPSIAAAPNGEVAISWDTYDKGDYDVYLRRMRFENGIRMEPPVPVAASQNFEARSSAAYDGQNRLWVAYEASAVKWGKDFGAYETTGVALYQGHTIRLKCFDGAKVFETAAELDEALPGEESTTGLRRSRRARPAAGKALPDPDLYKARAPSGTPQPPPLPLNSFPRLATDSQGAVYLTYRTPVVGRSPLGTTWMQNVSYVDGEQWKGPILVPNTDFWMDARAAMATLGPGHLLLVTSSDNRLTAQRRARRRAASNEDPMDADLIAADFQFGSLATAKLKPAGVERPAAPDPESVSEREQISFIRNYRTKAGADSVQLLRGEFHRHTEMSGDGGRDGPLIDAYRYMIDAAAMDWGGCCDHDNGAGREYPWWIQQKLTDAYKLGSSYIPMFSYERSVRYPEGHRNVVMARRGVRPLPRLPKLPEEAPPAPAPDTLMLYKYLRQYGGIVAMHTSATNMGTDWRDNDPILEPVVEIYQGDRQNYEMPGAPRSNNESDSIGGWRPLGFVSLALQKGYRLAFQASSDHISTHMSYCNLWVTAPTREAIMEAFKKRRVYGATDNILADVRCGSHFMGEEFTVSEPPAISVKLWGTANFAKVHIIRDGQYVYTATPGSKKADFTWRDTTLARGKTSYYYVRGEQADGELVWVSPMWITYR